MTIPNDLFYIPLLQGPVEDPRARMKRSPGKSTSRSPGASRAKTDSPDKVTHSSEDYRQLLKFKITQTDPNRSSRFKQQILELNNEEDEASSGAEDGNFEKKLKSDFKALKKTGGSPTKNQSVPGAHENNEENDREQIYDALWQGISGEETPEASNQLKADTAISSKSPQKLGKGGSENDYIYKKVDSPSPKADILQADQPDVKKGTESDPQISAQVDSGTKKHARGGLPSFDMDAGDDGKFFVNNEGAEEKHTDNDKLVCDQPQGNPENPFKPPQLLSTPRGTGKGSCELDSPEFSKIKSLTNDLSNAAQENGYMENDQRRTSGGIIKHHRAQSAQHEGEDEIEYSIQSISRSELNLPNRNRDSGVNTTRNDQRKQTVDDDFTDIQFHRETPSHLEDNHANLDKSPTVERDEKSQFAVLTFSNIDQSGPVRKEDAAAMENKEGAGANQKPVESDNNPQENGVPGGEGMLLNPQHREGGSEMSTNLNEIQSNSGEIPFQRDCSFGQKLISNNPENPNREGLADNEIKCMDSKINVKNENTEEEGNVRPQKEPPSEDQHQSQVEEMHEIIGHQTTQEDAGYFESENKKSSEDTNHRNHALSNEKQDRRNYHDPEQKQQQQQEQDKISHDPTFLNENAIQVQSAESLPGETNLTPNIQKEILPQPPYVNESYSMVERRQNRLPLLEGQSELSSAGLNSLTSPVFTEKNYSNIQPGSYTSQNQTQSTYGTNLDPSKALSQDRLPYTIEQGHTKYFLSPGISGASQQRHHPAESYGSAKNFSERASHHHSIASNPHSFSYLGGQGPYFNDYQSNYPLSERSRKNLQFMSVDGIFDHQAAHRALDEILRRPSVARTEGYSKTTSSPGSLSAHFAQYQSPRDLDYDEIVAKSQELQGRTPPRLNSRSSPLYTPSGLNRSRLNQSQSHLIEHPSTLPGLSSNRKIVQNLSADDIPPSKRISGLQLSPERRSAYQNQTPDKSMTSFVNRASPKPENKYVVSSMDLTKEVPNNEKSMPRDEQTDLQYQQGLRKEVPLSYAEQSVNSRERISIPQDRSEPSSILFERKNWAARSNNESEVTDSKLDSIAVSPRLTGNRDVFNSISESERPSRKEQHPIYFDEEDKAEASNARIQDLLKWDIEKFQNFIESGLFQIEEATDESVGRTLETGSFRKQDTQEYNNPLSNYSGIPIKSMASAVRTSQPMGDRSDSNVPRELSADPLAVEDRKIIKKSPSKTHSIESSVHHISMEERPRGNYPDIESNSLIWFFTKVNFLFWIAVEMLNSITQKVKQDMARRKEQNKKLFELYSS